MIGDVLPRLFALLVYPGVLWALMLALVVGRVLGGPASGGRALQGMRAALTGRGPFGNTATIVLALAALAMLPWPAPWAPRRDFDLWLVWGIVEASALASVLPGLLSSSTTSSRAAVREAQLGFSGRLPIWLAAASTLLVRNQAGAPRSIPLASAVVIAALAALLALPAAAGWPPFGTVVLGRGATATSSVDELSDQEAALAGWARRLLSIVWIALLATVFVPLPPLSWWAELLMRLGLIVAIASIARGLSGLAVQRTLPTALRWCWWIVLPLALAAVALLG